MIVHLCGTSGSGLWLYCRGSLQKQIGKLGTGFTSVCRYVLFIYCNSFIRCMKDVNLEKEARQLTVATCECEVSECPRAIVY